MAISFTAPNMPLVALPPQTDRLHVLGDLGCSAAPLAKEAFDLIRVQEHDVALIESAEQHWFEARAEFVVERNLGFDFGDNRGVDLIPLTQVDQKLVLMSDEDLEEHIRVAEEEFRVRHSDALG